MDDEFLQTAIDSLAPVIAMVNDKINESKKDLFLIAIDGKCASGKSTLGECLNREYDCNLFHMDDFFLQPYQRTRTRLNEVGGNVDYERFYLEVLQPLHNNRDIIYRPYSCSSQTIQAGSHIPAKRINIIEGAYSMHPFFQDPYDLKLFMDIDDMTQQARIRKRNGEEKLKQFIQEWIPKENAYFDKYDIAAKCVLVKGNQPQIDTK